MMRCQRGFSTIEALVALLILGMVSTTLTLVHHEAVERMGIRKYDLAAMRLVESLALRLGTEFNLQPALYSGRAAPELTWTMRVEPAQSLDPDRFVEATISVKGPDVDRTVTVLRRKET
jgi:Tfp pilus assembly protein PilV